MIDGDGGDDTFYHSIIGCVLSIFFATCFPIFSLFHKQATVLSQQIKLSYMQVIKMQTISSASNLACVGFILG